MREKTTLTWRHFDFWLLGAVALLTIFGITMIRSAVAGNIETSEHANNQLIFAVAGFVLALIIASIDYHLWASVHLSLYMIMAFLLVGLLLVGDALFGSARWFGFGGFLIQPSEFAKIVLILVLADFFTRKQGQMEDLKVVRNSLVYTVVLTALILLQPNLSTAIVMIVIWFALLWAAGLRIKHLLLFSGGGLAAGLVLFPILIQVNVIQPYQMQRITNFLFPDQNATHGEIYNIQQAMISIGSGGWFGQGYGHGTQVQLRFLKVRWSDFIYSAMAQEFGFVGTVLVMLLFLFIIFRCLRAARLARDTFGGLIAFGVATMLVFQAIVNIGVNLNLMPATGLTFPFISYGGSSLLASLISIGLVESVILRHKALEF